MKFGVREICDVVLKAKAKMVVGNKTFYKGEPVLYFDTLKSSGMEGASTTVYAQGGRGNARLMAWEGEKTVTFTMEDALISPVGLMILTGAGLIEGSEGKKIPVHTHEVTESFYLGNSGAELYVVLDADHPDSKIKLSEDKKATIYVMGMKNGEICTEPYIGVVQEEKPTLDKPNVDLDLTTFATGRKVVKVAAGTINEVSYTVENLKKDFTTNGCDAVMVDYYVDRAEGASQIEITPESFGGNFYLEASTLFRNTAGVDMPAEFIIPNCKIQSNFNFQMASSGDPSTFTFTMDAFPDYTRFDQSKKVLATIQMIDESSVAKDEVRQSTNAK